MRVQDHQLNAHLLDRALLQQVALDSTERLMRAVVRLLDKPQLFSLRFSWLMTVHDPLSLSKAKIRSFVSCLWLSGGKMMGAILRDSSQCTVVV